MSDTRILGIIPARGGSKGIPAKNRRMLVGKPLVAHTIEAALRCAHHLRVVVSTDCKEIAEISRSSGAEIPFMRPKELARDDTPTYPVVRHVLRDLKELDGYVPDLVVLLQPTSPLRGSELIDQGIRLLLEENADSVVSVCEAEHSPYWMYTTTGDRRIVPLIESAPACLHRQDLPSVYRLNGALYVLRADSLGTRESLLGIDTCALVMSQEESVDIDDEIDFLLAETLLTRRLKERGN